MSEAATEHRPLNVLILAAGLGTRMRSDLAKVLHRLDGRPLIDHVFRTATALAPETIFVVIGHQGEDVKAAVLAENEGESVVFVNQEHQLGTGDAVNSARRYLEQNDSTIVVLSGDVPMIRPETLAALVQHHHRSAESGAAATILTVRLSEPLGYGRIVRDEDGQFLRIVEQKDADEEQKLIQEINAGIYCFDARKLYSALSAVKNNNSQGEYYLTDVPELLRRAGEEVAIFQYGDPQEIEGVNNRAQLADLERLIRRRTVARLMTESGVTIIDPKNSYISSDASIGSDTTIYPNVFIEGRTRIGSGCTIRPGSRLVNATVGEMVEIRDNCLIIDSEIGDGCTVGPMAHLRGHAVMAEGSKVGNFVELKKTRLGKKSKASHLTYLGDAAIGEETNIGAGTITCNYDGKNKHETHIGDRVKIGSDTMLVAPVTVGDDAATGAGSVVTKDVEPGELVVGVPAVALKRSGSKTGESAG
ncbi:MAG TPA: bifunctional UDP-N-acetylglucosamine diphosphorylase/glucosamine-1-phosphate N-acetyltransferase GlmU [Pyrinomonadaceae bacterium]|nr:bifunctional UDP-N-acetylglucosamine diphosphorylase/glucosamine-1-phosphate N-acetyltransferase GlmU [Pyrinomonadaceae bacterium]